MLYTQPLTTMKILLIILIIITAWAVWSYFTSNVKEPSYIVIKEYPDFEIREYNEYIEAKVTVSGDYSSSMNVGFRKLAGYIFGGNISKKSISMTAPVIEKQNSESIPMTAPVLESADSPTSRTVSFIMPSNYSLETLPTPNDSSIQFSKINKHRCAVLKFSWYATASRVETKKKEFLVTLKNNQLIPQSVPKCARYNPPWNIPFMNRNEIIVDI